MDLKKYESIRPLAPEEVQTAIQHLTSLEPLRAVYESLQLEQSWDALVKTLSTCRSVEDFKRAVSYHWVKHIMRKCCSSVELTGTDHITKDGAYTYISNHRDIILDTSFLNVLLHENGFKMTASAMGSNLVNTPFLLAFAKLNRNFIIHRGLSPRETLEKSQIVSKFIGRCIIEKNRSVWIAQREGRTKDGNDRTQQGVIKMLSINCPKEMALMDYFKQLHIVPMAISYELDPTDVLKMPALLAQHHGVEYIKAEDEDYHNIVQGFVGQKGSVHISLGKPLYEELDEIAAKEEHANKQIQALVELLDSKIYAQYKLFSSNYIAYDMLTGIHKFADKYTEKELRQFERRLENRSNSEGNISRTKFLEMYANPVINKLKL